MLLGSAALAAEPSQFQDFDAKRHEDVLQANSGKVVLFNYWATWCAPCREEMPLLVALDKRLQARGFRLITVSADEPGDKAQALEFLKEHGAPAPVYFKNVEDDDAFIESINPEWSGALPALFLYSRQGKLTKRWIGETGMAEIEAAIEDLL